jgi:aspartate aminotransferase
VTQDIIHEMVAAWDRRRQLITDGLNAVKGLYQAPIQGAFYGYVDGSGTGLPIEELSQKLLNEAHVAVVPGTAFGTGPSTHFRLSFATSDENLKNAVDRIANVLGSK